MTYAYFPKTLWEHQFNNEIFQYLQLSQLFLSLSCFAKFLLRQKFPRKCFLLSFLLLKVYFTFLHIFLCTCRKLYNETEAESCYSMLDRFHIYPFFIKSFHSQWRQSLSFIFIFKSQFNAAIWQHEQKSLKHWHQQLLTSLKLHFSYVFLSCPQL